MNKKNNKFSTGKTVCKNTIYKNGFPFESLFWFTLVWFLSACRSHLLLWLIGLTTFAVSCLCHTGIGSLNHCHFHFYFGYFRVLIYWIGNLGHYFLSNYLQL